MSTESTLGPPGLAARAAVDSCRAGRPASPLLLALPGGPAALQRFFEPCVAPPLRGPLPFDPAFPVAPSGAPFNSVLLQPAAASRPPPGASRPGGSKGSGPRSGGAGLRPPNPDRALGRPCCSARQRLSKRRAKNRFAILSRRRCRFCFSLCLTRSIRIWLPPIPRRGLGRLARARPAVGGPQRHSLRSQSAAIRPQLQCREAALLLWFFVYHRCSILG